MVTCGLLLARPDVGAPAVVWIIGSYALLFGIVLLALAFRLRGRTEYGTQGSGAVV